MNYTITFTNEELGLVLRSLESGIYKEVASVINTIYTQINKQNEENQKKSENNSKK